jgi:hypothetical protein
MASLSLVWGWRGCNGFMGVLDVMVCRGGVEVYGLYRFRGGLWYMGAVEVDGWAPHD